ncbi:hypothetical protein GQ44DRAFT_763647 [Phaeosphaeriaceae sp. PMI808]|nr:hypothetical protein GQ44DRAFT_763647 [Phaeosphaeriaceae sp. PMI808]
MSIMFTKLSILHFYLRFLLARPHLRKIVYAVMVIVVIYSFVTSFDWLYVCRPLEKYWDLTITEGSCVNVYKFTVLNGVMNVVTDAIILLFPLAILRDLQNLAYQEKVAVTGIMMTGGLVVGISIIRAKMNIDMLDITDITWDAARMTMLWRRSYTDEFLRMAEMDISIICACLVSLKPFLQKYFLRFFENPHRHTPSLSLDLGRFTMPSITNRDPQTSQTTDKVPLSTASTISAATK